MGEDLVNILDTLRVKSVICLGDGAGANISTAVTSERRSGRSRAGANSTCAMRNAPSPTVRRSAGPSASTRVGALVR